MSEPEKDEVKKPRSVGWAYFWIAFALWFGTRSVMHLMQTESGELRWWWSAVTLPLCVVIIVYAVVDILRHRKGDDAGRPQ